MSALLKISAPLALVLAACSDVGVTTINPPDAPGVSIAPADPTTTDRLQLEITSMPDQRGVRLDYAWFRDGEQIPELTSDTVPSDRTAKGELWQAVVTPWAGNLEGTAGRAQVEILNTPPVVDIEIEPAGPTAHDPLDVVAVTSDADDDVVTLRYAWSRDGAATEHTSATLPSGATARGETWSVEVTPNDGDADGEPAFAQVEILNAPPTIDAVALGPEPARTQTPLRATAQGVQDIDGDPVELTYAFRVDGTVVQGGPSADLAPSFYVKGQRVVVDVTPRDGFEDGTTVRSNEIVIANTAPSATGAQISPDAIYTLTDATCAGLGFTDIDGDPAGFEYRWTVDGVEAGTGPTLVSSAFSRSAVLVCYATPFDGEDHGAEVTSPPVTVLNTPPSIDTVTLSPESPRVTDVITVSIGGATDADGDAISYRYAWTIDGAAIGHTGSSLDGSLFRKGQRIAVTVTPSDGLDDGTPVSSDAVVSVNSPPVVDAVTLTPDPVYTLDALTAITTASDPDGDPLTLTHTWYVDGTPQAETGATLASINYVKHEDVYVSVVANDGSTSSDALSSPTLTVSNSAPTSPELAIDPATPRSSDDLYCEVAAPSTDDDGDPITYSFRWELDDSPYEGTTDTTVHEGDTIPSSETAEEDVWQCFAVALDDEEAESAEAESARVTVTRDRDGTARRIDGRWVDVTYERCGTGTSCNSTQARAACSGVGRKVASHASDGSSTVYNLGATSSCYWSVSYYTVERSMPSGACLVGVSNLDWSSCCTWSSWHGHTITFGSPSAVFGYVRNLDSGYVSSYPNASGNQWGCQSLSSNASVPSGCTSLYVACVDE